jgi:four helix bundle protein
MNETQVWLKIIRKSRMLPENEVDPVLKESIELSRILNASIRTTRLRRKPT